MDTQALNIAANSGMDSSYLMEKKFEFMIESSNKRLISELNALKDAIGRLNSEIADLRKQVNGIQQMPSSAAPVFENSNATNEDAQYKPRTSGAEARNDRAVKPRFGDYEPKDVPIEKFFYFGDKPKR